MSDAIQTRTEPAPSGRCRFGRFELDFDAHQLLEMRTPVRIGEQQLRALMLLVHEHGRLVSRQKLRETLWPDGTHVDFEGGMYTCLRRLRRALHDGDAGENYVATVPGKGYRFVAEVQWLAPKAVAVAGAEQRRRRSWWVGLAASLAAALLGLGWWSTRLAAVPGVESMRALTSDGGMDITGRPASDGENLYYLDRAGATWNLMRTAGDPATVAPAAGPAAHMKVFDVDPGGERWLLGSFRARDRPAELWTTARLDRQPQRVGELEADDARWAPQGRRLIFAGDGALWSAAPEGGDPQRLAAVPGHVSWMAFAPDGRRLRFTLTDAEGNQALWEWQAGQAAHALRMGPAGQTCCGDWTKDGRYYLFSALQAGVWNLWAQREPHGIAAAVGWPRAAMQLTAGARSAHGVFTGFGRQEVVFYQDAVHEDLVRLDPRTATPQVLLPGRFAAQPQYSRSGRALAYVDTRDRTVWVAAVTAGGEAGPFRRLSPAGAQAAFPRWSPDGGWVAYASQTAPGPVQAAIVASAGGAPQMVALPGAWAGGDASTPDWSPDGAQLLLALERHPATGESVDALAIYTRANGRVELVPGSEGLQAGRWSPDGAWLAAFTSDQHQLRVYQFASRHWQTVASAAALSIPDWSRDAAYLYFQDLGAPGQPLYRAARGSWRPERVADFTALLDAGAHRCGFTSLAPDGAPLISLLRSNADLYAARLRLP